jgi:peptidoglycan/xylan/chitin deacetylase (PgdA/CDA1 family)
MKEKNKKCKKIVLSILLIFIIIIMSFVCYEAATVKNEYYISQKNLQIPIFVYHNIVKDDSQVQYSYMETTQSTFEKQITGLIKLGYVPISYQDLVDYKNGKKKISKWSFLITFDDGYEGVYEYAYPIAKKYNIPMTSFAIDNCVGTDGYYTWNQAKEMQDSRIFSICSHGLTHIEYDKVDPETLLNQTNEAYNNLQNKLNDKNLLKVFTYPYGLYTDKEIETLASQGYIENLTDNKINQSNKLNLSRLHRCYPLNDSTLKIILKIQYRNMRYGG